MDSVILLASVLLHVTGPNGQRIDINPAQVTSVREPRKDGDHLVKGTKCLIYMANGHFITTVEDCATVRGRLGEEHK
jgi:hypothetical protein